MNRLFRRPWLLINVGVLACMLAVPTAVHAAWSSNAPSSAAPTTCTSNGEPEVFSGSKPGAPLDLIPPAGTTITPGSTIGVKFTDETPLNTTNLPPVFMLDGSQVTPTLNPPSGKVVDITIKLPDTMSPGTHTASVDAWDTDQTEGGDCGHATFSFTVSPPPASPAPSPATTPVATTAPAPAGAAQAATTSPAPAPAAAAAPVTNTPSTGSAINVPVAAGLLLGGVLTLVLGIAWRPRRQRIEG